MEVCYLWLGQEMDAEVAALMKALGGSKAGHSWVRPQVLPVILGNAVQQDSCKVQQKVHEQGM